MGKSRSEIFSELLNGFKSISDSIDCASIFNQDGIVISSIGENNGYEDKLSALASIAGDLSSRMIKTLEKGEPVTHLLVGTDGFFVITELPEGMVLAVSSKHRLHIGEIIKHSLGISKSMKNQNYQT